jgi:cobaltochelatase CobT
MYQKLNEAFPIVAAALGHRLGVRVMVQGQTARTDGEMIVIPAYDGNNPQYRDVAWGYLSHEAAHIRYTDFGVFKSAATSPLRKAILNIIEDIRIEKRMAESYPGTRFTIEKTVAQLISEGGYEMPSEVAHPAVLLQAYLLFGLRSQVLGQTLLKGMAQDAKDRIQQIVPSKVFDLLETISRDVDMLKDTQEALSLTDQILLMFEDELEQEERVSMSHINCQEKSDSDPSEPDDCLSSDATSGESDEGTDSGSSDAYGTVESLAGRTSSLRQLLSADESELNGDLFETIRDELALGNEEAAKITLPVADEPPLDPVQGRLLLEKALAESGKLRASLQGLVQANRLSKRVTRRSGNRMDSNRLNRLGWNDPKVFRRMESRKAPNTAVHILVDRSPSMSALVANEGKTIGRRIDLAWDATLSLAMALEGIQGVNVGITAFPGKDGEASSVYVVLPHGCSVRSRVAAFGGDLDGSTPLAEAIWFSGCRLVQQREERKLLLVLTDGIPDDLDEALNILARCRSSCIEVTGIGLGIEIDRVFESCVSVKLISDLPAELNEICKKLLLAA